jgi:polysaccharide biosynthesis protein PslG
MSRKNPVRQNQESPARVPGATMLRRVFRVASLAIFALFVVSMGVFLTQDPLVSTTRVQTDTQGPMTSTSSIQATSSETATATVEHANIRSFVEGLVTSTQKIFTREKAPTPTSTSKKPTTGSPQKEEPIAKPTPPTSAGTPQASQQGRTYSFGFAVGETLSVLSENELAKRLDFMAELGVGWVRADLAWSSIEQKEGEYYWTNFDRVVRLAGERGIRVLPIITYTPRWARSSECLDSKKCHPRDPAEYAHFAGLAVERYAPRGVRTWEVWNEPNLRIFWNPGADASGYTELLRAAYTAIHAVDPGATVISGGLAPTATGGGNIAPREYLEQMYAEGAQGYFDALGFHPYSFPLSPTHYSKTNAWSQMNETEWSIRSIMQENGDGGKKIWLTEYGAPTGGPGSIADSNNHSLWDIPDHVTEAYQATILREAVTESRTYTWAGPLFWYSYKDLGFDTYTKENFFGIVRADGSIKPAFTALESLL